MTETVPKTHHNPFCCMGIFSFALCFLQYVYFFIIFCLHRNLLDTHCLF